jgi:hypothetical protein
MEHIPFVESFQEMWILLQQLEPYIDDLMDTVAENYNLSMWVISSIYFLFPTFLAIITFNRNWLLIFHATPLCLIPIVGWPLMVICAVCMRQDTTESE